MRIQYILCSIMWHFASPLLNRRRMKIVVWGYIDAGSIEWFHPIHSGVLGDRHIRSALRFRDEFRSQDMGIVL